MNWLLVALPLAGFYLIWFGYLFYKKQYDKPLLFFALAHLPYLLVNLVAPFRGILDPDYAGYSMGWITLPKGFLVPLIIGTLVISAFILATRALKNNMAGLWTYAFLFDLVLTVMVAFPLLLGVLQDLSAFRIELGEYLQISGIWVGLMIFVLFTGPTFYACYFAGKRAFQKGTVALFD